MQPGFHFSEELVPSDNQMGAETPLIENVWSLMKSTHDKDNKKNVIFRLIDQSNGKKKRNKKKTQ